MHKGNFNISESIGENWTLTVLFTYKQFITNWQIRHFPISHGNLLLKNGIVMQQRTNTILLYSKH